MTTVDDFSIYSRQYETQTDPLNSASFEELINVVSYNISAFGFNGATYDLTLGGSSNVIIEGSNTMQVYTSSNGVAYYTTTMDGSNRSDDLYYNVSQSNATTYFNTPYNVSFNFADSITLDTITVATSDAFKDTLSTTKEFIEIDNTVKITGSLQVDAPIITSGTLSVAGNLMADSNFRCGKSIFGSNINIYRERASNGVDTVGYGFQVNTSNQLELIKTMVFLDSNVVSKKVAVFGFTDILPTDSDDAEYLVFDELKGLGVGGGSNNTPTFTSGGFLALTGGTMLGDIDMNSQFSLLNADIVSTSNLTVGSNINTSYPIYMQTVGLSNISILAEGDISALSDIRTKVDIEPITNALSKMDQISGYTFGWARDPTGPRSAGVVAQEMNTVLPEVVNTDQSEDAYMHVSYGNISALLIQAIKDLSHRSTAMLVTTTTPSEIIDIALPDRKILISDTTATPWRVGVITAADESADSSTAYAKVSEDGTRLTGRAIVPGTYSVMVLA